jgi:hypothetical protein
MEGMADLKARMSWLLRHQQLSRIGGAPLGWAPGRIERWRSPELAVMSN